MAETNAKIKMVIDTRQAIKSVDQFSNHAKKVLSFKAKNGVTSEFQKELEQALKSAKLYSTVVNGNMEQYAQKLDSVIHKNEELIAQEKEVRSLRGKLGPATKTYKDNPTPANKEALDTAQKKYNTAVETAKKLEVELQDEVDNLGFKLSTVKNKAEKLNDIQSQQVTDQVTMAQATERIATQYDNLEARTKETAEDTSKATEATRGLSENAEEVAKKENEAAEAARQYTKEKEKQQNTPPDTSTKELESSRVALQEVLASANQVDQAMQFDKGKVGINELTRRLATLTAAHQFFEENLLTEDANVKSHYEHIKQQETELQQIIEERKAAMSGIFQGESGQVIQAITSGLDNVGSAFGNAGNYAINFADIMNVVRLCMGDVSAAVPLITSVFSKLTNAIKGAIDAIKNLINNMIKFTTSVANKFFSVMKNGLSGLSKAGNSIGGSDNPFDPKNIKRALQLLTKYVFGFRSFFFLYRRLRKLVGEGIENLVQFESETNETNAAITDLRTSLLYIKNAWAAAFAPIINVVRPILVYLMDAIAEVGNAIARFVGALTGQSVVLNAVRVDAGDYAKSLDTAGGSASKAADKTKKLTDRLAAFDDLNVLGVDRDPDGTGSGGGGGGADSLEPDPNQMFKYVEAVSSFATMIKEAWKKVDFTEVGKVIRDKLLEALRTPFGKSWKELQDLAYNAGRGLITFLNGIFEDKRLWMEVGNAIGEGLNTVGRFVEGLLKNNKINFGLNFAELIISAFKSFDPHLFLSNAERIVNLLVDNINAFFERIFASRGEKGNLFGNIQTLAEGLTRSLVNLILGINWDTIAQTALLIGNAILNGIRHALEDSDNPFMQDIGKFILEIQWAVHELLPALEPVLGLLGEIAGEVLEDIVDLLPIVVKIVKEFVRKWLPQLLDFLKEAMPVIKWIATVGLNLILGALEMFDFEGLVQGVSSVLSVIMLVGGYLLTIFNPLLGIATMIGGLIIGIARVAEDTKGLLNLFFPSGEAIIQGLFDGISNALKGIYEWFRTNVFEPIATAFTTLFGIHSPSTVFAEYGDDIIQGLLDGLNARIEEVLQVFTDLKESISEKWDDIKSATAQKWTEIGEAIKNKVFDIKNNIVGEFSDIKDKIVQKFTEIVGGISEAFSSLKEAVKAPLNSAIEVIESFVNKVIKGINDLVKNFDGISEIASQVGLTVPELKIPTISIPRLAQGAVIPPNKEFMAVLGDQSHGTNIEAPLDTIKQAVAEVLGTNNGNQEVIQLLQQLITVVESKNLTIGDKEIGKANARYTNQQRMIRGTSF